MLHRLLLRGALSLGAIYAWIFVFQFFYVQQGAVGPALASVLLTYALSQVVLVLLTPYTAQRIRYGFRRLLVYASLILAAAFATLAAAFAGVLPDPVFAIGLFALLMGLYRACYWTPYAVSRVVSPARPDILFEVLIAAAPACGGFLLTLGPTSPVLLLSFSAGLALLALVPLAFIQDAREGYAWSYRGTFHELFSKARRRVTFGTILSGMEASALLLLWPLAIFILLGWSYPVLGLVLSVTFLLSLALRHFFKAPLEKISTPLSMVLTASAWIMRLGVGSAVGVVLVDTYFYTGTPARGRAIDSHSFEQVADNTTYVDEQTALKEVGLGIGRILTCLIAASLASLVSVPMLFLVVFLCAGVAAAGAVYLSRI